MINSTIKEEEGFTIRLGEEHIASENFKVYIRCIQDKNTLQLYTVYTNEEIFLNKKYNYTINKKNKLIPGRNIAFVNENEIIKAVADDRWSFTIKDEYEEKIIEATIPKGSKYFKVVFRPYDMFVFKYKCIVFENIIFNNIIENSKLEETKEKLKMFHKWRKDQLNLLHSEFN